MNTLQKTYALFNTTSIKQIGSVLPIFKLSIQYKYSQILCPQFRNCQFGISCIAIHCWSMLSTPKLFWENKQRSPNKRSRYLVRLILKVSVTWYQHFTTCHFFHLRSNSTYSEYFKRDHLHSKILQSDTKVLTAEKI